MPIIDLQKRLSEAGRIRIGKTVPTASGKKRPDKLEAFRFTTQSQESAEILAQLYGGEAKPWAEAPTGTQFEVLSESDALRVLVPPEAMSFTQWFELWKAGGCERRCNGERMLGENNATKPCICDPENRECKPHTRLSVILRDMPTSGLWRLDTSGFNAAEELAGGFELARMLVGSTGRSVLAATLRLEQREKKKPGEKTKKFAVPVLDFNVDAEALVGEAAPGARLTANSPAVTPVPALPAPSLRDQIEAVDAPREKPQRKNAAPEVKPTGLKPKGAAPLPQPEPTQAPTIVDALPAQVQPVQTVPQGGPTEVAAPPANKPAELASFFDELKDGEAAGLRWMVLRNHGWSTDAGNDVAKWAATQPIEKLDAIFDELLTVREKVMAK